MAAGPVQTLKAYAGLGARILGTRFGSTRPFKVTWMLTDRCDCRCTGCLIWQRDKRKEMSAAEIGAVLAGAPSLRWVNLTGGEPFLRDDMVAIAEAVRAALPNLAVLDFPTTGQRTDVIVRDVEAMTKLGIPKLFVTCSIEGPPDIHDELRGRPGAFDNMIRTYVALRAMKGVDVYLGMTLTERNAGSVDAMFESVRERVPGVDWSDVHFNVYTESGHYYENLDADARAPDDVQAVMERALRSREGSWNPADQIEAAYIRLLPEFLKTGRSPLPCKSLRAVVFIDSAGDVYPCTVWDRKLGNVKEQSLYDILDTAEAEKTREMIAADDCPGCWSPCEAHPTIVASAPESLTKRPKK